MVDDGERRPWSRLEGAVAILTLAPIAVVAVLAAATHWTATGDQAVEVLRMHDVGTSRTPLTGAWSRFGWDHPGPLLFWIGAPAQHLFGGRGVLATIGLLNLAGLAVALAAARRLGGTTLLLLTAAAGAVLTHSLGANWLVDPWNPFVTYLPLLAFLLAAATAAEGRARWALPAAVVTGSLVAQSHLAAAPAVLAGAVGAGVWCWRRTGSWRPERWPVRSAALAVALWSGPVLDQLFGDGNLVRLARYAAGGSAEPRPTLRQSLGAASRELGIRPAWTGGPEMTLFQEVAPVALWRLGAAVLLLAAAGLLAFRRRDVLSRRLVVFSAGVAAVSVVAVSRTTGQLLGYVLRWTWPVAALGAVAAAQALRGALPADLVRRVRPALAGLALVSVGLVSAATLERAIGTDLRPQRRNSVTVEFLSEAVRREVPPGRYRLEPIDSQFLAGISEGFGIDLLLHGYDIDFPVTSVNAVGTDRLDRGDPLASLVVVSIDRRPDWDPPRTARRVANYVPVPARDRVRDRAQALEDRLYRSGRLSALDLMDQAELDDAGIGYEVWLVPAPPAASEN